jgi:hypothetical protein
VKTSLEWRKKLVPYQFVWAMGMTAYASVNVSCQSHPLAVEKCCYVVTSLHFQQKSVSRGSTVLD